MMEEEESGFMNSDTGECRARDWIFQFMPRPTRSNIHSGFPLSQPQFGQFTASLPFLHFPTRFSARALKPSHIQLQRVGNARGDVHKSRTHGPVSRIRRRSPRPCPTRTLLLHKRGFFLASNFNSSLSNLTLTWLQLEFNYGFLMQLTMVEFPTLKVLPCRVACWGFFYYYLFI